MGVLNKMFIGMEVADGASKARKAFNDTNNKYHDILGNQMIKAPAANGEMNALNSNNTMYKMSASELIDGLAKEAGIKEKIINADKYFYENMNNFQMYKNLYNKTKNPKYKKLMNKAMLNTLKIGVPSAVLGTGAAIGMARGIRAVEDRFGKNKGDSYYPEVAGAALLGAGAFDAISNKSVLSPVKHMGDAAQKVMYKYPKKIIGKSGPVGKLIVNIANVMKNQLRRGGIGKRASEEIDDIFFNKTAGFKIPQKAKDIFVRDFIQEGIAAVPYMAAPATTSYMIGRDIRHGGAKIKNTYDDKIVIDVPTEKLKLNEKTASYEKSIPWGEFFKEELPRRGVQGLSRSLFPTAVVALTGRNITNAMEKVNDNNNNLPPVESGKTRIIIQTSSPVGEKRASEFIDELFFKTAAKSDASSDAEKDAEKTIARALKNKKKDPSTLMSVFLTPNIKKQERMME
jgi:hypothetical protein